MARLHRTSLTRWVQRLAHDDPFDEATFVIYSLLLLFAEHSPRAVLDRRGVDGRGCWLHITGRHEHEHAHEVMAHNHRHVHDAHHQHVHDFPWDGQEPNVHPHKPVYGGRW